MNTENRIEKFVAQFLDWIADSGFFEAPASLKFHGAYEGGLFDHCFMVTEILCELTRNNHLKWSRTTSPFIIGMFHDLCKIDVYKHLEKEVPVGGKILFNNSEWEYNNDTLLKGHGDKSVLMLASHITLTEEEVMCIRYHMGAYTDKDQWADYNRAVQNFSNVLWTHHADMIAAYIRGI